ncbi:hypothetical protein [Seonamhaeicola aphaedonensis]|uniref:Fimbrial assembly protein PilN n=1 Tax=Seonamhaeicola aphaedonensis TaxID=1461338 RepID=A0A3D9H9L5_9FLAO|nr:hypothetical protein [Seonamhaeicola aphaedonensis]RED45646.1 hypothetical protein DFQ02_10824 [Seonamhaeicola aphaedonensis]
MISKIKNSIKFKTKDYYVLGITQTSNGQSLYKLLEIQLKQDELFVINRFCSEDFDEIIEKHLGKDCPIVLHIDGSNIVNKSIENKTGYRNELVFKGNLNDFYFYEYKQNSEVFASVSRRQHVHGLLEQIKGKGFFVVHLSIGPFVLANLFKFLKQDDTVSLSNLTLNIKNGQLVSFKNGSIDNKAYIINGDRFDAWELPLLASFFDYTFPMPSIEFNQDFLLESKTEYKFKKWFRVAGIFCLAFILGSLTISHFLMDSYTSKLSDKRTRHAITQNTLSEINALKQKKELKEKILMNNGMNNKSFITKYIADIGNSTLPGITLNAINIMPLTKKIKPEKKIDYTINTIILKGEVTNDNIFNEWVKKLEQLTWKEKISIDDYIQETKNVNVFTIKIII